MDIISLILITYLIGFVYLLIIRKYDIYDQEPLGKLILFSFFGGMVSIAVASIIYIFVHPRANFFDAIFLVGTIEEFAKLLSFLILYKLIKKDFDEIVDGIIYIAALSLGFSVVENLFYALDSSHPYKLLFLRFLTATIGHVTFSVYMGIALYVHKKVHRNYLGLFLAFVLSTLAHGVYDGVIFQPELNMFFIPVLIVLIIMSFKLLKIAYAYSRMKNRFSLDSFTKKKRQDFDCCHCGGNEAIHYQFKKDKLMICDTCGHVSIEEKFFYKLLKYYRPLSNKKKFIKINLNNKNNYIDFSKKIFYHKKKQKINAPVHHLQQWFTDQNHRDLKIYHNKFTGKVFYYLGFRFF
jgi:RsiW-degrading membrane proteinase PrsW (M82 family)